MVVPFSVSLAAAEILLRPCLRHRASADESTKTVRFVEGQPSDIIKVKVGDYFLEDTMQWIRITMYGHFLVRNLRYRHAKRADPESDQKKALRSANRLAFQMWGKSCAANLPEQRSENRFSALDQGNESSEEEDDQNSDVESVSAAVATRFILDSGSTYDIMNKGEVPRQQPAVSLPRSESVATANGTTHVKTGVEIKLAGAGSSQIAMTMDSPSVLSLGREIPLELISDVPYLPPHFVTMWNAGLGMPVTAEASGEAQTSAAAAADGDEQSSAPAAVQPETAPGPGAEAEGKTCKIPADHYLTHLPKHPKCDACQVAKMQFRPCRRSDSDKDGPTKFGVQVTLDHIVTLHPDASCYEGMADAVVIKDRATGWIEIYPLPSKSTESTIGALRGFLAPGETLKEVWGDGSGEITGACEALKWPLQRSTPGRPQTNGVAERAGCTSLLGGNTHCH